MAKFVFAYTGGAGMAQTDEEMQATMAQWGQFLGGIGAALIDGGNPFAESATVSAGGAVVSAGASGLGGYSIIEADSLDAAVALTKGCPNLTSGGNVEVYAAIPM